MQKENNKVNHMNCYRHGDVVLVPVCAGIDFALTLAAEIAAGGVARGLQLALEYAPAPPVNSGRPETAPPHVLATIKAFNERAMSARTEAAETAAARV